MKSKTVYYCTECGNETPKWQGQCPACGSWNTLVEQPVQPTAKTPSARLSAGAPKRRPAKLDTFTAGSEQRFDTGLRELNRVLGGGAVRGSLVLVGGAPGIGKSTLLLQICSSLSKTAKILYVTGEESENQLKLRADRLGVSGGDIYVLAETDIAEVLSAVGELKPDILIVDSIQTMYSGELTSTPGSVGQVKECTLALMQLAKGNDVTVFVIGHVNKEGAIAGPRVLEHMVDCVLYFEGSSAYNHRVLRAAKNRFGSTNEIGLFEMLDDGLAEVSNASEMLLSGRPENASGTCVACCMEGTRPVLAEIQALLAPTSFNIPRRTTNGIDYGRAMMLLAVLEKRGGLKIGGCDAYINVIGGLYLSEPAADLATILAIASSYRDKPVPEDLAAVGEVGLTGELRTVTNLNQRLEEISRLGFRTCIMPVHSRGKLLVPDGLTLLQVRTINEAMKKLF